MLNQADKIINLPYNNLQNFLKKHMRKLIISIFLVFSVVFSSSASANFIDVVPQSLFFSAVQYFSYDFPIIDLNKASFNPLSPVTKAEFYKLLLLSAGYEPPAGKTEGITCSDVNGDEWFAPYVKKSINLGLVVCNETNKTFNPAENVSRAAGLEKIFKIYKLPSLEPGTGTGIYYDIPNTSPYAGIAQTTYELRLLSDYKSGQFLADKLLTRAETINILYNVHSFIDYLPDLGNDQMQQNKQTYGSTDITSQRTYSTFIDVWTRLTNEYIEKNSLNKEELLYGAIEGMVDKVGDPYTVFFEPADSDSYLESLDGNFEGIGIYLNETENGEFEIITPLKGSPAEKAGIKPGDIILEADGVSASEMSLDDLIQKLRGESGSKLTLKIKRDYSILTFTIIREQIEVPYVEGEMKDGIGIIHYYQFTANSHDQFLVEIKKLKNLNPKGLILDMRNNPGGYLYSSQDLLSHFLPADTVFIKMVFADGYIETEKSSGPGELKGYYLVVLLNEGSASASEIAALALRDLNNVKIVGKTSYGKGKIQELIYYGDDSSLKISTAKWLSPAGTYIDNVGIIPDFTVNLTDADIKNNLDPQLDKAIALIKNS